MAVIRLHEEGIASNRKSECYGELKSSGCTNCPSQTESMLYPK